MSENKITSGYLKANGFQFVGESMFQKDGTFVRIAEGIPVTMSKYGKVRDIRGMSKTKFDEAYKHLTGKKITE